MRYIQTTPLRELTFADAALILGKAISTFGTAGDFNHFLPRILETHAYQGHYLPETLPGKIGKARAEGWTTGHVEAVVAFMRAYISAVNAKECNTSLYYDLRRDRHQIVAALPELGEFDLQLNDPDAVPASER